jgi:hypothetical protein
MKKGAAFVKFSFLKVVKAIHKQFSDLLGKKSQELRMSFSCFRSVFTDVASKNNTYIINTMIQITNALTTSNQCLATFLATLDNTLNARRKYLLLNESSSNSSSSFINGSIVGFQWTEMEVNTLTPAFIKFANCYSLFPNTLVSSIASFQAHLAADPNCKPNPKARVLESSTESEELVIRFLQVPPSTNNTNDSTPTNNTKPSGNSTKPNHNKPSNNTKPNGSNSNPNGNNTKPAGNNTKPNKNNTKNKDDKPKNFAYIQFDNNTVLLINQTILALLNSTSSLINETGNQLNLAFNRPSLKTIPDYINLFIININNIDFLQVEKQKIKSKRKCENDYVYLISNLNATFGKNGTVTNSLSTNITVLKWKVLIVSLLPLDVSMVKDLHLPELWTKLVETTSILIQMMLKCLEALLIKQIIVLNFILKLEKLDIYNLILLNPRLNLKIYRATPMNVSLK